MRSGLVRGFDVSIPSNRLVLGGTPVIGAVAGLVTLIVGDGFAAAVGAGIAAGGSGFLAWATTRELHPDRPGLAGMALLAAPWGVLLVRPDLLVAGLVLVVARIVSGTTGRGLRWIDVGWVAGYAALTTGRDAAAVVLGCAAVAILATAAVVPRRRRETIVLGVLVAIAAAAAPAISGALFDPRVTPLLAIGLLAGVVAVGGPSGVATPTDREGGVISPRRVRAARGFATIAAGATAMVVDPATLAPVWAALAATALRPRGARPT